VFVLSNVKIKTINGMEMNIHFVAESEADLKTGKYRYLSYWEKDYLVR
jgi:hypothetical protein